MKTKAAVLWELNAPWTIEEIELDAPGPNEVLVKLAASGLCHSDEHLVTGDLPFELPIIGGHEGAGVVQQVGANVSWLAPGDHVVFGFIPSCGRCVSCSTGHQNLCDLGAFMATGKQISDQTSRHHAGGKDVGIMCLLGTFAEHTVVHEASCIKIEKDVPLDRACLLGCGVVTGWGSSVYAAEVAPGDTVVVVGVGGIGANAIQGARIAGAKRIVAIDPVEFKREKAMEFGATHTVNARNTEPVAAVQAATNGLGADVCIEAVGHPEVLRQAFYARDLAGTVVQVGVPTPDMVMPNIPMIDFFGRGGAMKPSWYGDCLPSRDFPLLVDLHLQGRLPLEDFVTETIGLSEIEQAFHRMERGEVLRSVVLL